MTAEGERLHPATSAGLLAGQAAAATDAIDRRRRRGVELEVLAAAVALSWCQHHPLRAGPEGGELFVAAFRTAYAQWPGWGP